MIEAAKVPSFSRHARAAARSERPVSIALSTYSECTRRGAREPPVHTGTESPRVRKRDGDIHRRALRDRRFIENRCVAGDFDVVGDRPGRRVITSAYTFFATAACVARVGATPIFVDIDPATYNISLAALENYLRENCRTDSSGILRDRNDRAIRAIIPVHLFGLCCDMAPILAMARKYRLIVIEDAAQAIGAEYGKPTQTAGTMGEAGVLSFYPSKNLGAAGDAGMVLCREAKFAEKVRSCRQHGMEPRYYHHFIGGNFRLDEIQAAILNAKLPHLDQWSAARRAVADFYRQEFERAGLTNQITLPAEPYRNQGLTNHHIYHQYVDRKSVV